MKVLIYDGTFEGLLSAIHTGMKNPDEISAIISDDMESQQSSLFDKKVTVHTDEKKAAELRKFIRDKMGKEPLKYIMYSFLSEEPEIGKAILDYVSLGMKEGKYINRYLTVPCVDKINKTYNTVCREGHRMLGFVRFEQVGEQNPFFYSKINTDYFVLPIISIHFKSRMPDEKWIIHDEKRGKAAFYDGNRYIIKEVSEINLETSKKEAEYMKMWKSYFHAMGIESRKNPKLQQALVPLKYRGEMSEFKS